MPALEVESHDPLSQTIAGIAHRGAGRTDEAAASFARAIELDPEFAPAATELFLLAGCDEERRQVLEYLYAHQYHHGRTGNAFPTYRDLAFGVLDPVTLLNQASALAAERPGSLAIRAAIVRQCIEFDRPAEAAAAAREAAAQFPFASGAWFELARAEQAAGRMDAARAALARAVELAPDWNVPRQHLALLLERSGQSPAACAVLTEAVTLLPRDPMPRLCLANLLWRTRNHAEALAHVQAALELDLAPTEGWNMLRGWCSRFGRPDHAREFARHLTRNRPTDPGTWLAFAESITNPSGLGESHAAIERAIELNPRLAAAWDLKARLLALEQRFDEAIACCQSPVFGGQTPIELALRRAQLTASRGESDAAAAQVHALLTETPSYTAAWELAAQLHRQRGHFEDARAAALQAVRLRPSAAPWLRLAEIELAIDNLPDARRAFQTALLDQVSPLFGKDLALFFDFVGERKAGRHVLPDLIAAHRNLLHGDDWLWGKVGYALCASEMHRETAEWLADWRERPRAESWMLHNLASALTALGRDDEAAGVRTHLLDRGIADHTVRPQQTRASRHAGPRPAAIRPPPPPLPLAAATDAVPDREHAPTPDRIAFRLCLAAFVIVGAACAVDVLLGAKATAAHRAGHVACLCGSILAGALAVTSLARLWRPRPMPVIALFVAVSWALAETTQLANVWERPFPIASLALARPPAIPARDGSTPADPNIFRSASGLIEVDLNKFPLSNHQPVVPDVIFNLEGVTISPQGNAYVTVAARELRARSPDLDLTLDNIARHLLRDLNHRGSNPVPVRTRSGHDVRRSVVPNAPSQAVAMIDVTLTNELAIVLFGGWYKDKRGESSEMERLLETAWSAVHPCASPVRVTSPAPLAEFRSAGGVKYFQAPGGFLSMRMDALPSSWVENVRSSNSQEPVVTKISLPDPARILISYKLLTDRFLTGATPEALELALQSQAASESPIAAKTQVIGGQRFVRTIKRTQATGDPVVTDAAIHDNRCVVIETWAPATGNLEGDIRAAGEIADRVLGTISLQATGRSAAVQCGYVARFGNSDVVCAAADIPPEVADKILSLFRSLDIVKGQPGRSIVSREGDMLAVEMTTGNDAMFTDPAAPGFFARIASLIQWEAAQGKPVEVRILDSRSHPRLVARPADLGRPVRKDRHTIFCLNEAFVAPAQRALDWFATTSLKETMFSMHLRGGGDGPIEFCVFAKVGAENVPEWVQGFRTMHHAVCQLAFPNQAVKLVLTDADFKPQVTLETAVWRSQPEPAAPAPPPATAPPPSH